MPMWSRRAAREGTLQRLYDESYNASLQSLLRESNQEYHVALDSWKQTLETVRTGLGGIEVVPQQSAREQALLGNIKDIEKQCHDRITFLETRLFRPGEATNPYGTGARTPSSSGSVLPGAGAGASAGAGSATSVANPAGRSSSSINRVAVGSKTNLVPPSPPPHVTPPMPRPKDMPYKKYTSSTGALPGRSPAPPVPATRVAGSQPSLGRSGSGSGGSGTSAVQPTAYAQSKSYTLRGDNARSSKKNSKGIFGWGRSSSRDNKKEERDGAALQESPNIVGGRRGSPAPTSSQPAASSGPRASATSSPKNTPDAAMTAATLMNDRIARSSVSKPAPTQAAPPAAPAPRLVRSPATDQWSEFAGTHNPTKSESPESSPPLSPAAEAPAPPTPAPAPAPAPQHQPQPRKVNRYIITRNPGVQSAALKAATVTAGRRAQQARQAGAAARGPSPEKRSGTPTNTRAPPAGARGSPAGPGAPRRSRTESPEPGAAAANGDGGANDTAEELDEWDLMAREKIKGLRGVDENAAIQILSEVVLKGDPVTWDDIAGLEQAKASLKETVVYPFLRPDLFSGLREPALGMLLFGPPGTGKTMLARAVATESKSTFFSISASSLTSKYMGESEKLVRALFQMARALAPSIIFVDEIDSILTQRSDSGEHEASRRIKNEFLVQWSDLQAAAAGKQSADSNVRRVLVLGATNLPWAIDEAARRRFVRRQYIPLPESETRRQHLLKLLSHQKHGLSPEDIEGLVVKTDGYSGSDLTALAKDAAMGPLRALGEALLTTNPDQIRPMGVADFEMSMRTIRPSVSPEGLQAFEQWAMLYGSSGA